MFRILKPGGRVIICHNESREAINAMHGRMGREVGGDMLPQEAEMRRIFCSAGFGKFSIDETGGRYLLQASRPCQHERSRAGEPAGGCGRRAQRSRA